MVHALVIFQLTQLYIWLIMYTQQLKLKIIKLIHQNHPCNYYFIHVKKLKVLLNQQQFHLVKMYNYIFLKIQQLVFLIQQIVKKKYKLLIVINK